MDRPRRLLVGLKSFFFWWYYWWLLMLLILQVSFVFVYRYWWQNKGGYAYSWLVILPLVLWERWNALRIWLIRKKRCFRIFIIVLILWWNGMVCELSKSFCSWEYFCCFVFVCSTAQQQENTYSINRNASESIKTPEGSAFDFVLYHERSTVFGYF